MTGKKQERRGAMITRSITFHPYHLDVLVRLAEKWPDVRDNRSKAIRRLIEQEAARMEEQ